MNDKANTTAPAYGTLVSLSLSFAMASQAL